MYEGAAVLPSSADGSGKPSLVMLTGVLAVSSARMKEAWLSEEACLAGVSRPGVPARLKGREKLKEGRGSGADASELMDGDLRYEPKAGETMPLLELSLRDGCEWKEVLMELRPSSSVGSRGEDMMLDDRLGKSGRGGTRPPVESNEFFFTGFSGDCPTALPGWGEEGGSAFSYRMGLESSRRTKKKRHPNGNRDRTHHPPKKAGASSALPGLRRSRPLV